MSETPETDAAWLRALELQETDIAMACSMKLERERDLLRRQVEALVHLYAAHMTCYICGMIGGPGVDGSQADCRGATDACEKTLAQWALEQAKKGGGGD